MDDALLSLDALRLALPSGARLLDGVSLRLERGRILGVVGESGSGKSLTGLSVLGLQPQGRLEGKLAFEGQDLLGFGPGDWRRFRGRRAAMIFQDPMTAFLPVRRIGAQIAEQIRLHSRCSRREAETRVIALLSRMGVPAPREAARRFPHELSGGLRQRAMIAMALSCDPDLVIADEPTTALDVTVQAQILMLLREIGARRAGVMLITHDMGVVAQICTDIAVLYAGVVVESGPAEAVLRTPWHPYTRALLRAIPPMDGARPDRLPTIEGTPPAPEARPPGCVFAPRCPERRAACAFRPALRRHEDRSVACVLYP